MFFGEKVEIVSVEVSAAIFFWCFGHILLSADIQHIPSVDLKAQTTLNSKHSTLLPIGWLTVLFASPWHSLRMVIQSVA